MFNCKIYSDSVEFVETVPSSVVTDSDRDSVSVEFVDTVPSLIVTESDRETDFEGI